MKYYASHNKQLSLDLFRSSLEGLDKSNRWVSMGDLLPWPELEREYNTRTARDSFIKECLRLMPPALMPRSGIL